tara:strand:+ start:578 stop:1486 length:909 start_codon:yes stop_codon:yes gene_type:complete
LRRDYGLADEPDFVLCFGMINRRRFVSQSALAVGAATIASSVSPTVRSGEMTGRLKKAVKYTMVNEPDLSISEKFSMLKEIGFDGVELRTEHREDLSTYLKAVDQSGLRVHGTVNSDNPDLETAIKFSSDVGGDSILMVARYDRKRPLMESWNETQAIVRKGLAAAEKHQVKILVENVWAGFLISPLDVERYVDEIDNPWFGSYFDVGNNVRWGVPEHWIQILGDRIGKLDIKEWDERKHAQEGLRAGFGSELGEGTIDWSAVRAALREIDFNGWATAEVKGGNRERLADIATRMDHILGLS